MPTPEEQELQSAASRLYSKLNLPGSWRGSVGCGSVDGHPGIHVYLKREYPVDSLLTDGRWEGFPVVTKVTGEFRLL
jgi:hypothetical protein